MNEMDEAWEEWSKDLKIFHTEDDGYRYTRCWMCNQEKKPLFWVIYKGRTTHLCEECKDE